jgi:hypothetical protein
MLYFLLFTVNARNSKDETLVSLVGYSESFVALMEGIGYVIWIGYKTNAFCVGHTLS